MVWALIGLSVTIVFGFVAAWLAVPAFRAQRAEERLRQFRDERLDLNAGRLAYMSQACELYDDGRFISLTRCLTAPTWTLTSPVPVHAVTIDFEPAQEHYAVTGMSKRATRLLPEGSPRVRYRRYADVISDDQHLRPGLWWNGAGYDLTSFAAGDGGLHIKCAPTRYFDMFDVCETLAHEFVIAKRSARRRRRMHPFRSEVKDPFDLSRRTTMPAIGTLPIFRGPDGTCSFFLHARDSSQVASAGGFRDVVGGQFQPSSEHILDLRSDADLWLSMAREFAEELLGYEEAAGGHAGGRIDFDASPFSDLQHLREIGALRLWVLGLGMDPLSLWPNILTVAVIEEEQFRAVFPSLSAKNSEGTFIGLNSRDGKVAKGFMFDEQVVNQMCSDERTAPTAAGCLRLAWEHRETVLR